MSAHKWLAAAAMLIAAPQAPMAQVSLVLRVDASVSVGIPRMSNVFTETVDTTYRGVVYRAKDALNARRWRDAAELYETALLSNARNAEHWQSYGNALFNSARYREAIGAYQRGMQLGARDVDDALWNISRSYARLGNRKQAVRWLDQALARGARTQRDVDSEPAFKSMGPAVNRASGGRLSVLASLEDFLHT